MNAFRGPCVWIVNGVEAGRRGHARVVAQRLVKAWAWNAAKEPGALDVARRTTLRTDHIRHDHQSGPHVTPSQGAEPLPGIRGIDSSAPEAHR